jgi:cytosine/adenosine deaminase-related metal-dependent hydrolase
VVAARRALDLEMIRWSAMLGALEALEQGTTAIVDHHESPTPSRAACR